MLRIIEQRVLPWLLIAAIGGGVLMYRDVGVIETKLDAMMVYQATATAADAETRGEILRLNGMIVDHERRHGRDME